MSDIKILLALYVRAMILVEVVEVGSILSVTTVNPLYDVW